MNPLPTDTTATASGALDEFLERYEAAQTPAELLEAWCRAWPELAPRLRALAAQSDRLRAAAATPAPRLSAGQSLGPFCIVREIATGGMGVIYEARQVGLERRVALKTIRSDRASEAARERFVREQQALALLHHTHIVPVFASGVEGDLHYYGMQFIEGVTLHTVIQRLRRGGLAAWRAGGAGFWPAIHEPSSPESLPQKFPLSYFRFAASIVAQAAEAVHSAHERQVIHRDLKPANLMLDEQGKCWLIDFGLARVPASHLASALPAEGDALDVECAAMTQQALGTQPYMSPEHFELLADERSDVWGLGVILYELLTLRRAFPAQTSEASRKLIEANAPTPPSQLVRNVPATLAAIFTRATQSAPAERYASAQELADDLRNWLDHKPTRARRILAPESLWLWAKRNPGRAIASGMAGLMACAALVALFMALSARANFLATRANAAIERARLAEQGSRDKEREILMRDLVTLRLSTHTDGWTKKADDLIARIAPLGVDEELRTQAASCLMGIDAEHVAGFTDAPAWWVALSADGKWLLTGGPRIDTPTRLVELKSNHVTTSNLQRASVVTFLPDNTPLQIALPTADDRRLILWDVSKQQALGELALPAGWTSDGLISAVSRDGTHLAIEGQRGAGVSPAEPKILVIDLIQRRIVCSIAAEATALALADKGQLLAAGDQSGKVTVYSAIDRSIVNEFAAERGGITALDLCRSPLVPRNDSHPGLRFYLAAAAAGGSLAVWNLESGTLVNQFHGSPHGIHAIALSEDATILASCGRNDPRLWDVSSGRLLMQIRGQLARDWHQVIRLADNASLLAISCAWPNSPTGGCQVLRLESDRGVRALRGLSSQVAQVWFAPDDALIAALSHTWELGVWEAHSGKLLHVFEAPIVTYTDNADAVFSSDRRRFAFATNASARLWDLSDPSHAQQWPLSQGLCEQLTFNPLGELVLCRWEFAGNAIASNLARPHAFRSYVLANGEDAKRMLDFQPALRRANDADMSSDGQTVIIDGRTGSEPESRAIMCFDHPSAHSRWSLEAPYQVDAGHLFLNRTATLLFAHIIPTEQSSIIDVKTGKVVHSASREVGAYGAYALSSSGKYVFGGSANRLLRDWTLYESVSNGSMPSQAVFTITLGDNQAGMQRAEFTLDDERIAWGGPAGEVLIADIQRIRTTLNTQKLARVAPVP